MHPDPDRRLLLRGLAATSLLPALPGAFAQQAWPAKPILVKVAFPAGGPADASIRAASVVLQRNLQQNVLSDNLPGANGTIGAMAVLKAAADGYTLLGTTGIDFLVAPLTVATARYQPEQFHLLGVVGVSDFVLVSSPAHNFRNVDELLAAARKSADKPLSIAHWGAGSGPHLVGADLQARTGVRFLEVPYKGAAPSMNDVAGGQVDLAFVPLGGPTLGMIQAGRLKPIGLASPARNPALPNVPTLGESAALRQFDYSLWSALLAPPKTPQPVVARLTAALNEWIASPENAARIATNASRRLAPMTTAQAAAFLKTEHEKFTGVARTLKLEPQ